MYPILVVLLFIQAVSSEKCNQTECVSLSSCPHLQPLLANPPASILTRLNESICDSQYDVRVCCKNTLNAATLHNKVNKNEECGYQDLIYEFPWMVSFVAVGWSLCSGALINERYVLTAGSCASPSFQENSLVKITLGDFNLKNNRTNCSDSSQSNLDECLQFETYDIEKAIPHPLYRESFNNIGLIRLDRNVKFNEYIRPICLPPSSYIYSQPGDVLKTSGFIVHFDPVINMKRFKKNVSTRFISLQECRKWNIDSNVNIPLSLFNTCSEDIINVPQFINYFVDHGGPIMKLHNNQWYVESILALAFNDKNPKQPIINTNVSYYLDWIYNNMEPWD